MGTAAPGGRAGCCTSAPEYPIRPARSSSPQHQPPESVGKRAPKDHPRVTSVRHHPAGSQPPLRRRRPGTSRRAPSLARPVTNLRVARGAPQGVENLIGSLPQLVERGLKVGISRWGRLVVPSQLVAQSLHIGFELRPCGLDFGFWCGHEYLLCSRYIATVAE